jgi:hypothetical protein
MFDFVDSLWANQVMYGVGLDRFLTNGVKVRRLDRQLPPKVIENSLRRSLAIRRQRVSEDPVPVAPEVLVLADVPEVLVARLQQAVRFAQDSGH